MFITEIKYHALMTLTLRDCQHFDALKDLKNTPKRWHACGLTDLIGYILSGLSEPFTKQKLSNASNCSGSKKDRQPQPPQRA